MFLDFNPIALRKAKIICNFGLSECNRVKIAVLRSLDNYLDVGKRRTFATQQISVVLLMIFSVINKRPVSEVREVRVRTLKLKKGLFFEFNAPTIRKDEFLIL